MKSFGTFTLAVPALLVLIRLGCKIPKPLVGFLAGTWFACCVALAVLLCTGRKATPTKWGLTILGWIVSSSLLLGTVYRIDRAGWLWFCLTGYEVTLPEDFPDGESLSIAEFLRAYPAFSADPEDSTKLVLSKGNHEFPKTVIVPCGTSLRIEPGAVLLFGTGRSLVSFSPIIARGTQAEPIVFTARCPMLRWGAVGVVDAGKSVFEFVRVDHGRHAVVNGHELTGSLSVLHADVEITHCEFRNLVGKDAVNVRNAQVLIRDNTFANTFRDGLDLDGSWGEVSHNRFIDCEDEGIDLSDNEEVRVFDNDVADSKGGRIAADVNLASIKASNILRRSDRRGPFRWLN